MKQTNAGKMYTAPGISMMLVVKRLPGNFVEYLHFDDEGVLHVKHSGRSGVEPLAKVMNPRTCWPKMGKLDLLEIEKEERQASEERRLKRVASRKAARKSRPSNKIKRATVAA